MPAINAFQSLVFCAIIFSIDVLYGDSTRIDICKNCNESKQSYSCGDNLCCCDGIWACCVNKNLTIIPELPESITTIDFSRNNIQVISADTFENIFVLPIRVLILKHNGILNVSADSFAKLSHLQELNLKGNKNIDKIQLSKSFYSIQKDKELTLGLAECGLHRMAGDFFDGFLNSKLVKISLRQNRLKMFDEDIFKNLPCLETLDLSENWIEYIGPSRKRVGHNTIENLILADNNFFKFPPWFCTNDSQNLYPNLKFLDLSRNFIAFPIRRSWSCLKNLRHLSLAKNVLSILQDDIFSDLVSLETLNVSRMVRSIKQIGPRAFNILNLRKLHFDNNRMKFKPNSDIPFEKLFIYLPNLRSIHLESNDIRLGYPSFVRMLEPLNKLERLHLGDINLRSIPRNFLNKFPNLTVLNLSRNKISFVDPEAFTNVTKLEKLFMYENRITGIDENSLPDIVLKSLKRFNLADNPFSCTPCKNMWFRNWIDRSQVEFPGWPHNYTCHFPPCMRGKSLQEYHPKPEDCQEKNPMIAVYVSVGVFLVIIVGFGVAGYHGRWYLRYWLIRLHRWRKNINKKGTESQGLLQDQITYDAYVIYHESAIGFIRATLLPFMEDKHGYRLFIHDREAEIDAKVDVMVENIYRSNYVIAVVSRQFLKDPWCDFQLSVTRDRQVELKRNYLLLLTLEDVDKGTLNRSWCVLLTKTPTAEWCDKRNDIKRKLFEDQLITLIPRNSQRASTVQVNDGSLESE